MECTTLENSWRFSYKTKNEILIQLAIVLMNIYFIGMKTYIHIKYPHEYRKRTASFLCMSYYSNTLISNVVKMF